MADKKTHWYIKRGDQTVGPVEREFVEKSIREGELAILDYVSESGKPWKMIRDIPSLAALLGHIEKEDPEVYKPKKVETPKVESRLELKAQDEIETKVMSPKPTPESLPEPSPESSTESLEVETVKIETSKPPQSKEPPPSQQPIQQAPKVQAQQSPLHEIELKEAGDMEIARNEFEITKLSEGLEEQVQAARAHTHEPRQKGFILTPPKPTRPRLKKKKKKSLKRRLWPWLKLIGALIAITLGFFITKYLNER